jgi:predicted alpha/beta superfamily hydrolase
MDAAATYDFLETPPPTASTAVTKTLRRVLDGFATVRFLILLLPSIANAGNTASSENASGNPVEIGRSYVVPSRILRDERRLAVYLPPHYAEAGRRFPVIYLLDGGPAEDFHHVTGLAAISSAYGLTREVIVVGIEGRDRRHDLTSPSQDPTDLKSAPTSGGADTYRRFLVEEVKPWVEKHYRTDGHDALVGESLAGLFVVETALSRPDAFDDYIAVSPSLWWNREALSRGAAQALSLGKLRGHRLWLAVGNEPELYPEMKHGIDRLVATLQQAGANAPDWSFNPMLAETHATIYHPALMAAFRKLYAMPAKLKQ